MTTRQCLAIFPREYTSYETALISNNQPWSGNLTCSVSSWLETRSDGYRRFCWATHNPKTSQVSEFHYSRYHTCMFMGHSYKGRILFDAVDLFDDLESVERFRNAYAGKFNQMESRLIGMVSEAAVPAKEWRKTYLQKYPWLRACPDWLTADAKRKAVEKHGVKRENMRFYPRF